MRRIGLDFGTTNSILSYYDERRTSVEAFQSEAGGDCYIPTVVSYRERNGEIQVGFGKSARMHQGNSAYRVVQRFKLYLGEDERQLAQRGWGGGVLPLQAARDYLQALVEDYKKKQRLDQLEAVVVTVPEVWWKDGRLQAREELRRVLTELELPSPSFISEPVAACAYFAYTWHLQHGSWYDGHVLVVDYGGGTLDISLCQPQADKVRVLAREGVGFDKERPGRAGVAFDEEVVRRVYRRIHGRELETGSRDYFRLIDAFERYKIDQMETITEWLKDYCDDPALVEGEELAVAHGEFPVTCEDLAQAFREVIEPELAAALQSVGETFALHGVDRHDQQRFRVLLVGGFSQFYLVEDAIRRHFSSRIGADDKRFDSCFSHLDRSLAIAKGAALVAAGIMEVTPTCPLTLGIRIRVCGQVGQYHVFDDVLWQQGDELGDLAPKWGKIAISMGGSGVELFAGDGNQRHYMVLKNNLDDILPNYGQQRNTWKIGLSVDRDQIIRFHARDKGGAEEATLLGTVQARQGWQEGGVAHGMESV